MATPFGIGPDESNQMIRAAEVVRGDVFTPTVRNGNGLMWQAHLPLEYGKVIFAEQCFANKAVVPASCAQIPAHGPVTLTWTPFGSYPLTYYALAGWPTFLPDIRWADLVTHLLTAAICAALLAGAFLTALEARRRLLLLGLTVAVTPAVLYNVGTINPSALTIAAAIAAWTSLAVMATGSETPTKRQCLRAGIAMALLAVARPDSLLWLGAAVAVCAILAGRARLNALVRLRRVQVTAGAVAMAVAAAAGWAIHADYPHTTAWTADTTLHIPVLTAVVHHLQSLPFFGETMLTAPGTHDLVLPQVLEFAYLAMLAALVGAAAVRGSWRGRTALAAAVAAAVGLPAALEAAGVDLTGYFWQARYSLPVAVGVPVVASLVAARPGAGLHRPRLSLSRLVVGLAVALVAAVQGYAFYQSLHRYTVGSNAPWNHLSGAGSWSPPVVPARWLLVIFLALDVLLVAAVWLPWSRGRGETSRDLAGRTASGRMVGCAPVTSSEPAR